MKTILTVVGIILLIDLAGFFMWALSGQFPADQFYIGSISKHLLALIIK